MGGGMHGGWGGGMHAMGGGWAGGGWAHSGGMGSHFAMAPASRGAFSPRFSHGAFSPRFSHFAFHDGRFRHGFFFRNRFRRFAFFGAPFYYGDYGYDYAYDGCVRQVPTRYGLQWVNVCGYGNYVY
jgi:hypothetical protein